MRTNKSHVHLLSFQKGAFQLSRGQPVFCSTPLLMFDKEKQLLLTQLGKPSWIFAKSQNLCSLFSGPLLESMRVRFLTVKTGTSKIKPGTFW